HGKGSKLMVYKFRRRKDYRRKQGHRQEYTWLTITSING
ncbi:MAG: large subunit ribosomal protein L21, partial [Pseudohongiellaceae bacterium]